MKNVFSILIFMAAGLLAGFIVSKLLLGPDWQDAFASPAVIGAVIGTAIGLQRNRKKKK
ncbi:MAG: hypothetical protein JW794_05400 [Candidatus Cloacimonetes bacterium]|nr:hypothetical protein [Candidatus Cloacimonadota bacterium]